MQGFTELKQSCHMYFCGPIFCLAGQGGAISGVFVFVVCLWLVFVIPHSAPAPRNYKLFLLLLCFLVEPQTRTLFLQQKQSELPLSLSQNSHNISTRIFFSYLNMLMPFYQKDSGFYQHSQNFIRTCQFNKVCSCDAYLLQEQKFWYSAFSSWYATKTILLSQNFLHNGNPKCSATWLGAVVFHQDYLRLLTWKVWFKLPVCLWSGNYIGGNFP